MNKPEYIVIHHTATPRDKTTVEAVDRFHRDKDWGGGIRCKKSRLGYYVQYHWFLEPHRTIHCAEDDEVRWHAGASANMRSIAISLTGWFDPGHDAGPTQGQVNELARLLNHYVEKYSIPLRNIVGHRYFMTKTCPGQLVADTFIRSLVGQEAVVPIDHDFTRKFEGQVIVAAEDRGRKWWVHKGARYEIDKAPEFEARIRAEKDLAVWMSNKDIARIPKA